MKVKRSSEQKTNETSSGITLGVQPKHETIQKKEEAVKTTQYDV